MPGGTDLSVSALDTVRVPEDVGGGVVSGRRLTVHRYRTIMMLLVTAVLATSWGADVVKLSGEYEGEPVEAGIDQSFEVGMGIHRVIGDGPDAYEWIVLDTGLLRLISERDGTETNDGREFSGGFARCTISPFEPVSTVAAVLVFGYVPVGAVNPEPADTYVVPIIVTE